MAEDILLPSRNNPDSELSVADHSLFEPQIIAGLCRKWLIYNDISPRSREKYTQWLKAFAQWSRGQGITEPVREDIIRYRDELSRNKQPSTVNNYIRAVKSFYRYLEAAGIRPDITRGIRCLKLEAGFRKGDLNEQQCADVIETQKLEPAQEESDAARERRILTSARNQALLILIMTTGMRTIEVRRADYGDIQIQGDSRILYVQGKGKNEKGQYVKIPDETWKALRSYLALRGPLSPRDPLFASISNRDAGQRLTTRSISRICKNALIEADLNSSRLTAHSLRHTNATLALKNGASVEQVQQVLRHADINTTMIYVHDIDRERNAAEDLVARAIFDELPEPTEKQA